MWRNPLPTNNRGQVLPDASVFTDGRPTPLIFVKQKLEPPSGTAVSFSSLFAREPTIRKAQFGYEALRRLAKTPWGGSALETNILALVRCKTVQVDSRATMDADSKFLAPGADGELAPGTNLWRKGLVYTTRTGPLGRFSGNDYRISVGFKQGVASVRGTAGFHDVYRRVVTVARRRVSQMTCPHTGEVPNSIILGHTWRPLGENIVTSLITLSLRCSVQDGIEVTGEPPPTEEALRSPGGATLEELKRLAPQGADEIYNEFDFTEPSTPKTAPITLSYGESISASDPNLDFSPFVERAEKVARSYHALLQSFGEASTQLFRIQRREWFLASQSFVTIHICFDRY